MLLLQFTGLSGAGKSTLAGALQRKLEANGISTVVVDGDVYRRTLCRDLGFSAADRKENIRRLAREAHLFCRRGTVAILAAINPYEETRQEVAQLYGAKTVWVRCATEILVRRDPKGLYRKALLPAGHPEKIDNLSGINDPYEPPPAPDLVLDTGHSPVADSVQALFSFVLTALQALPR